MRLLAVHTLISTIVLGRLGIFSAWLRLFPLPLFKFNVQSITKLLSRLALIKVV